MTGGRFGTNPWEPLGTLPSPILVAEPVRVVVLDCSGVAFADAAGAREVVQLASRCQDAGIHLLLAQCNASVLRTLTQAGLLDRVTPEQLFVSVQDAAAHALERLVRGQRPRGGSQGVPGCSQGGARQWLEIQAEGVKKGAEAEDEGRDGDEMIS